jgi:hypothetical protein
MSEASGPALSLTSEVAGKVGFAGMSLAKTFAFSAQRRKSGLVQGAGGVALLAVGIFLLTQITATPGLAVQLAILGALCTIGGLGFMVRSLGDTFGRLVVDEAGIAIRPSITGYSIRWSELDRWEVKLDSEKYPEANSVLFWTQDTPCALFLTNSSLTQQDRVDLRQILQTYAADKEASFGQLIRN